MTAGALCVLLFGEARTVWEPNFPGGGRGASTKYREAGAARGPSSGNFGGGATRGPGGPPGGQPGARGATGSAGPPGLRRVSGQRPGAGPERGVARVLLLPGGRGGPSAPVTRGVCVLETSRRFRPPAGTRAAGLGGETRSLGELECH